MTLVRAESVHLRDTLPPDNPHNRVLRVIDIARYIGVSAAWLRMQTTGNSVYHTMQESRQLELSRFFQGWDQGTLIKARVGNAWQIVNRATLAQMAAAPGSPGKVHQCVIDLQTLGLRVK